MCLGIVSRTHVQAKFKSNQAFSTTLGRDLRAGDAQSLSNISIEFKTSWPLRAPYFLYTQSDKSATESDVYPSTWMER